MRADAKRAVRDRENILSIVSHDLKNPLTSIVMCASTLFRSEFALSESGQKCVGIIQRAAGQMMALVEDLLDFGTIGANSLRIQTARWDCARLIAEAVELLEPIAKQRSLELVVNAPPRACAALCDRQRIVQVLSNLIGNAIKFAGHGQIVVDCREQGTKVVFAVRDSGPGIPADQLDKIFTARWHALQPGREGTGLGLTISKALVEAHGGRIWVESQPGRGSTFFFTLPRASIGVRARAVGLPSAAERRLISLATS
jgi:signal transduction histidine kinase